MWSMSFAMEALHLAKSWKNIQRAAEQSRGVNDDVEGLRKNSTDILIFSHSEDRT